VAIIKLYFEDHISSQASFVVKTLPWWFEKCSVDEITKVPRFRWLYENSEESMYFLLCNIISV